MLSTFVLQHMFCDEAFPRTKAVQLPEQCWYRSNAGTRKVLAPEQYRHQENADTRRGLAPGKGWHQERGIKLEDIEERDWNRDNLPKPDTEGQVIGTTATHDTTRIESGDEEITIAICLASVMFAQL